MRNALRVIIVFITGIFFFFTCQPVPTESSSLGQASVILEDKNGWVLTVQADGSGELLHQHNKLERVSLPSKTFPFKQLSLLPAFAPRTQATYPYRWTYCSLTENETRQYGLPDTAWGAAWFEKAYLALEQEQAPSCTIRKLKKTWGSSPPPGVAVK